MSALSCGQHRFWERLQELRLRAPGRSSLVFGNRQRVLSARVDAGEMEALLLCLCGGSRYAFEECISEGYLPFEGGIRIGVCGRARYEGRELRGICEISSLVIRFPHASDVAAIPVLEAFSRAGRGLLIYSAPGVGKTTALRALALALGRKNPPMRVVVIDERMEFSPEEYEDATVDILRGYHRPLALQIALVIAEYNGLNVEFGVIGNALMYYVLAEIFLLVVSLARNAVVQIAASVIGANFTLVVLETGFSEKTSFMSGTGGIVFIVAAAVVLILAAEFIVSKRKKISWGLK